MQWLTEDCHHHIVCSAMALTGAPSSNKTKGGCHLSLDAEPSLPSAMFVMQLVTYSPHSPLWKVEMPAECFCSPLEKVSRDTILDCTNSKRNWEFAESSFCFAYNFKNGLPVDKVVVRAFVILTFYDVYGHHF